MINYNSIGTGSNKVLVFHGWKMEHTCFDGMVQALDKEKFTYIFADLRGYGLSRDLPGPYSIEQTAADLLELADSLNLETFHIIGHSMGGKVICRLAADAPERIKSAIGVTPCPPVTIPFDDQGWALFSNSATDMSCREEVFRLSTGNRLTPAWYKMIAEKSMQASEQTAFSDYLESWVNYECVDDCAGSRVPLKIIAGEFDPDLTYGLMQETFGKFFPNVEIMQLSNCGHYPMYETPLALAAEWENFLGRHVG